MITIFCDAKASIAASVYAVASAISGSLKTVILQFSDKFPVEDILIGNGRGNRELSSETISNTGMDALVRYQSFSTLTKERFNMCVTPVLKSTNLLDLVTVPLIESFFKDITEDTQKIQEIVTVAKVIYDNVVIVLDDTDTDIAKAVENALITYDYKVVRSIIQGEKMTTKSLKAANEYFLIHDYSLDSMFSIKYYRKFLNTVNVMAVPYNVSFRDAYLSGDLLMFLRKNITVDSANKKEAKKEDINAEFIMRIMDFAGKLNSEADMHLADVTYNYEDMCWEHKKTIRTGNIRRIINGENVFLKEEGHMRKRKVVTINLSDKDSTKVAESNRVSNYMYKTSRATFDRLLNIAKLHKRSINAELNHIVNNYIFYIESSAMAEKQEELKRIAPVRKALIS